NVDSLIVIWLVRCSLHLGKATQRRLVTSPSKDPTRLFIQLKRGTRVGQLTTPVEEYAHYGPHRVPDNRNSEIAQRYHDATKHSYASVRNNPHFLDFDNQPLPFKIY